MAENNDSLNRLKPLTDVLLEHWERPRRAAEERATDLEEQLNKARADLEVANRSKAAAKLRKKNWKEKARDYEKDLEAVLTREEEITAMGKEDVEQKARKLEEKLTEMTTRAAHAEATAKDGVARAITAERKLEKMQRQLEEAEQSLARERVLGWRKRGTKRRYFGKRVHSGRHRQYDESVSSWDET